MISKLKYSDCAAVMDFIPDQAHIVNQHIMNNSQLGYKWEEDGNIIGVVLVSDPYHLSYRSQSCMIELLHVDAKFRKRGIGSSLIKEVISNTDKDKITLIVEDDNIPMKSLMSKMEIPYEKHRKFNYIKRIDK